MDKRSTGGMAGEWRQQGFSGHALCRASTGAACRGGVSLHERKGTQVRRFRVMNLPIVLFCRSGFNPTGWLMG